MPPATQRRTPKSRTGFSGVYPILYAFFDRDGRLDRAAMRRQVDSCIAAGAHGIALLGLVTEFYKLNEVEKREVVEVVAEAIAGRVPLAVTVSEQSVHGQVDFVRFSEGCGAAWMILQPPLVKGYAEAEYVRFIGAVAAKTKVPVAIQNNPTNLDVALTNQSLITLARNHPNITLLKGEGPALSVAQLIEDSGGGFDVFCGHGGKELPGNLRSGCVGLIPAPDAFDIQVRIMDLFAGGTPTELEEAERLHRMVLPAVTFALQSMPIMITYGKRLFAKRIGLGEVHDRAPSLSTSAFGLAEIDRFAAELGPMAG